MAAKYKIVFTDYYAPDVIAEVARHVPPGFEFDATKDASREAMLSAIPDADFFIAMGTWGVDKEMLKLAPKLKFVQKWGVGIDNVDMDALRAARIPLAITTAGNSIQVAEFAVTLMLAAGRRLVVLDQTTREGQFLKSELRTSCIGLWNRTVGIFGMGNIGKRGAKRVLGFEPKEILYHDIVRQEQAERELGIRWVPKDELLRQSDYIWLNVPLTEATRKMIGPREFELMKQTAIVVNTCRGGVLDEQALYEALSTRRILGAAIDVYDEEPTRPDNPLFKLDNVVVTPHASGCSFDNIGSMAQHCFDNIVAFVEGRPLPKQDVIIAPESVAR